MDGIEEPSEEMTVIIPGRVWDQPEVLRSSRILDTETKSFQQI